MMVCFAVVLIFFSSRTSTFRHSLPKKFPGDEPPRSLPFASRVRPLRRWLRPNLLKLKI